MADMVTKQELEAAKIDVKHAGEAINEEKVIKTRLGRSFKSIPLIVKEGEAEIINLQNAIDIAAAAGAGENGWTAQLIVDESGKNQQEINNKNISDIRIIHESALILDSYAPAYSNAPLSTRFSTLSEAKEVYPEAINLTDTIDRTVLQQAINDANGRKVVIGSGRELYLNTVGVVPDGHAGNYCLLASSAVELITDGSTRANLIVPANSHGLVGMGDYIAVNNLHFLGDRPPNASIGHMIKFIKAKQPKVLNCEFTNVADAAVNFGYNLQDASAAMDIAIANGELDTFDMFQFGSSGFEYIGNLVNDCYGDGGLEVQGSYRGIIARNDHRNCIKHAYRIVGCKDTDIFNNHGADIGTEASFSAMLSLFSGALTREGVMAWMYNEDLRVHSNTGENVRDAIHAGLGGLNLSIFDNDIGAWGKGLYIFHTNPTCRYGLKDSRIYSNTLRGTKGKEPRDGIHLAVGNGESQPIGGDLLHNVNIVDNDISFRQNACYTSDQTPNHKITKSTIRNKYITKELVNPDSSVIGTSLRNVEDSDLSGSTTNITNGTELVVTNQYGVNIYGTRKELKFARSGNVLILPSRADMQTGQLVTVRASAGGSLPSPLSTNTPYYLIVEDSRRVRLAASLVNAFSGTEIALTSDTVLHNFMTFI